MFDRRSGDFWVLAPDGQAVVRRLELDGPLDYAALVAALLQSTRNANAALASMIRSGLLTASDQGLPVVPEWAVDWSD